MWEVEPLRFNKKTENANKQRTKNKNNIKKYMKQMWASASTVKMPEYRAYFLPSFFSRFSNKPAKIKWKPRKR